MGVQLIAVATPSAPGSNELPAGLETASLGCTYYVEVWVQDQLAPGAGISGGWIDVNYTTAVVDAVEVFHLDFDAEGLSRGEIDDPNGVVRDLGGGPPDGGVGIAPQWARLAYVQFVAAELGQAVFELSPGSLQFSRFDRGNVDWPFVDLGTPIAEDQIGGTRIDMTIVHEPSVTDPKGEMSVLPNHADWVHDRRPYGTDRRGRRCVRPVGSGPLRFDR